MIIFVVFISISDMSSGIISRTLSPMQDNIFRELLYFLCKKMQNPTSRAVICPLRRAKLYAYRLFVQQLIEVNSNKKSISALLATRQVNHMCINFPPKRPVIQRAFPCYYIIMTILCRTIGVIIIYFHLWCLDDQYQYVYTQKYMKTPFATVCHLHSFD